MNERKIKVFCLALTFLCVRFPVLTKAEESTFNYYMDCQKINTNAPINKNNEKILLCYMAQYCIPPIGSSCNPNELAHYENGVCVPDKDGFVWDPEQRRAFLEIKCPDGYYREKYTGTDCDSSLYKDVGTYIRITK